MAILTAGAIDIAGINGHQAKTLRWQCSCHRAFPLARPCPVLLPSLLCSLALHCPFTFTPPQVFTPSAVLLSSCSPPQAPSLKPATRPHEADGSPLPLPYCLFAPLSPRNPSRVPLLLQPHGMLWTPSLPYREFPSSPPSVHQLPRQAACFSSLPLLFLPCSFIFRGYFLLGVFKKIWADKGVAEYQLQVSTPRDHRKPQRSPTKTHDCQKQHVCLILNYLLTGKQHKHTNFMEQRGTCTLYEARKS